MADQSQALCRKCNGELDTTNKPRWCKACRAKYQREYQSTRSEMNENRGYAEGAAAMRNALAMRFQSFGSAMVSGIEAAHIVAKSTTPGDEPFASNGG